MSGFKATRVKGAFLRPKWGCLSQHINCKFSVYPFSSIYLYQGFFVIIMQISQVYLDFFYMFNHNLYTVESECFG